MTRADFFIGDNRHFQDILYDYVSQFALQTPQYSDIHQLLLQLGKYGDNGPDGNRTVFNLETILAIKSENFAFDQAENSHV